MYLIYLAKSESKDLTLIFSLRLKNAFHESWKYALAGYENVLSNKWFELSII